MKYAKPAPQAKTSFFQSGNALKNDENWSKYVILIVFTVLRQNTYGKSRSVGSFTHYRPTELKIWYLGGTNNGTSRGPVQYASMNEWRSEEFDFVSTSRLNLKGDTLRSLILRTGVLTFPRIVRGP
jgi:hypothetical protein